MPFDVLWSLVLIAIYKSKQSPSNKIQLSWSKMEEKDISCDLIDNQPGKGRGGHVSHFSERPHHNWVSSITAIHDLRQPLNANRPPSAHLHPSRCVLTTTPSAARRSTLARCVCNSRRRFGRNLCAREQRHHGFDIHTSIFQYRHNCRSPS